MSQTGKNWKLVHNDRPGAAGFAKEDQIRWNGIRLEIGNPAGGKRFPQSRRGLFDGYSSDFVAYGRWSDELLGEIIKFTPKWPLTTKSPKQKNLAILNEPKSHWSVPILLVLVLGRSKSFNWPLDGHWMAIELSFDRFIMDLLLQRQVCDFCGNAILFRSSSTSSRIFKLNGICWKLSRWAKT